MQVRIVWCTLFVSFYCPQKVYYYKRKTKNPPLCSSFRFFVKAFYTYQAKNNFFYYFNKYLTKIAFKETVSAISSDSPCKDVNVQCHIYNLALKAFSNQVWVRCKHFCFFKLFIFICTFFVKTTCAFLVYKKKRRNWQK